MVAERSEVDHDRLRFEFVDMLFALAIAEVATHVSELLAKGGTVIAAPSAWSDLVLAFSLIVMSWIGWSNAKGMKDLPAATSIFSLPFIVLVIDVVLVVVYYILVKGVEMPDSAGAVMPSAKNETRCVTAIFLLYIPWDFITKGMLVNRQKNQPGRAIQRFWSRGKFSIVCFFLSAAVLALCEIGFIGLGVGSVISIDTALFATVLLFRALKGGRRSWWIASAILYVAALIAARLL